MLEGEKDCPRPNRTGKPYRSMVFGQLINSLLLATENQCDETVIWKT